jgi:Ca-activated chloride channel family protein
MKVRVVDKYNNAVTGLTKDVFRVSEKGKLLEITSFDVTKGPAGVTILLDWSGSTRGKPRKLTLDVVAQLLHRFPLASDYFIAAFTKRIFAVCEECNAEEAAKALTEIGNLETTSNTAFYDAVYMAVRKLEVSRHSNRVLLVFSDGQDNESKVTYSQLRDAIKDSAVTMYSITYDSVDLDSGLGEEGLGILKELSEVSGGKSYVIKKDEDVAGVADVLAAQINQHYLIGFKPPDSAPDQKWHSIKIKMEFPKSEKHPHYDLLYRSGYYSR